MEEENEMIYDDLFKSINQIKAKNMKSKSYKGMGSLVSQMVSTYRGENTSFGKSSYDDGMNWDVSVDNDDIQGSINEYRAQNQGWLAKTGSGLGRIGIKAGSEIAKIPGYIGGGIAALGAEENEGMETFVNNSWIKAINSFNEEVNSEYLPVYVKKAVSEGNLWQNISSIDFWATDGADGIGFVASMLAPGAALKALGVGSKLSKIPGLAGNMSAATGDVVTATVANTMFESAAEAQGAMSNFDKNKNNFLNEQLSKGLSLEESELAFKQQKARLGRDIFVSNLAILAIPNAIQSSMLWGKGINKSVSKMLDSDGKLLSNVIEPTLYQKALNRSKNVLGATASEGFLEEAGQMTVENMFTKSANKNQLKDDNTLYNFNLNELGENYIKTISSTEGQKAMFLGAFLGGTMSAISGAKQDVADRKATQSLLNIGNNAIDSFYKVFQTDVYTKEGKLNPEKLKEKFEAFGQIEQLNLMYNEAVQKQDKEALEKLRDLAATQLAYGFIMNDELGLDVLKEHLNQSSQFDEIVSREQEAGNKTTKEEIIKNVMEKATVLQKAYSDFNDFAPSLIEPTLNSSQTQEDVLNFRNKLRSNYLTNKASINLYKNELKKLKEQRTSILSDLDLDSNLVIGDETIQIQEQEDSRLKQNKESILEIEKTLNDLKKLDNSFWNKKELQKDFDKFTKENKKLEKETSEEKVQKAEETDTQIKSATSTKDLEDIKTDNPIQKKEIEVKKQEFAETEDAVLTEELDNKKAKESLIKNQDLNSLVEFEDTAFDPITGKEGIVMENNENSVVIQTDEGQLIEIKKPKIDTDNISSDEEVEDVKEDNEDLSSKSNFSLPSKFNETFKSFVDFMMKPLNKKGLKTSFKLNTENIGVNSQNAIQVYNEAVSGKTLSYEDKNLLFNWLPLVIEIDGNNLWSGYPGGKGDYSNPDEKFTIRKNIVDAISQGISLENINGVVAGQSSPELNCEFKDNKPVKNNVLEIDYIKDITNDSKDLSKLEIYHVNLEGKLIPVSQGADLNPSAKTKELLSTGVGNIYVTIKSPLGHDVPVKLNFSRLGEQLTVSLLDVYKHILTHANEELLYTQSLSDLNNEDSQFYNPILYENLKTKLKEAISLLGNKENEITLEQIIETIILEDSGSNSHLKIVEDESGQFALEFKEGNRYYLQDLNDVETLAVLTKDIAENKYRNIITIPNKINKTNLSFKNNDYVKYLFDTKALTTNVSTTSHSFKPEEATIWLEPGVTTTKQNNNIDLLEQIKKDIKEKPLSDLNSLLNFIEVSKLEPTQYRIVTIAEKLNIELPEQESGSFFRKLSLSGDVQFKNIIEWLENAKKLVSEKINLEKNKSKPEQTNAFDTNPNFKSTKTVVDPDTGESFEIIESLEDLQKQLETEVSNRDKAPIAKLKAVFDVRIKKIEEKIRNIEKNSVPLQKDFVMEVEKEGTKENKEVVKAKVKNTLSKAEQIKEIEQMTQLNNMLLLNPSLPQQIKDKFEELKNKYSDEFNKLPKKCN